MTKRQLGEQEATTQRMLQEALEREIRNGNCRNALHLLTNGASLDSSGPSGERPLHFASKLGQVSVVKALLEAGADTDATNEAGLTPLMLAVRFTRVDVVELLIQHGADPNAHSHWLPTALMLAAERGDLTLLQLLLNAGASPDARDSTGRTATWVAAASGNVDAVRLLASRGADLEAYPPERALYRGSGLTALQNAITAGNRSVSETLIELGADPNAVGDVGWPPLALSAELGDIESAKLLLRHGADCGWKNEQDQTAGEIAQAFGHGEAARFLREIQEDE